MKKSISFGIVSVGLLLLLAFGPARLDPSKDKQLVELVTYVLSRAHFAPSDLDDAFSENVFMNYLNGLDGRHQFFLQSDINSFSAFKNKIDDEIKSSKISFFAISQERYLLRYQQVKQFYSVLLDKPFDFSSPDEINLDFENLPYSNSISDLQKSWRKFFKYNALGIYYTKKEAEKQKKKDDPNYTVKPDDALEIETREALRKDMKLYFEARDDLNRNDFFAIYLNAIAEQFDPHTNYLAPSDKDRFDQNISGKFEGIGARLTKRNQEIEIVEVISGGPVWRGKMIEPGDKIMKVAQKNEMPVDVVGMRLDDVIKLIKGPKGTQVYLTIKKVDGFVKEVEITRDVIELEEAFAKSTLIEKEGKRFGLIDLPRFYVDFSDYDERNAATDVKKEIQKLKEEGMEGLIIDLRGNGGGSLKTVVDMTGYFIETGPVVQVKSTGGQKQILSDMDRGIEWEGPLVVLVNEFSASASEILAAALQDYQRAIVLGSKQTFGKGTVQNVIDLNQIMINSTYPDLGAMKVTTDKFYRINGGSTQLEGVKSDVVFPNRYAYIDIGEKNLEQPLKWDQISPARYQKWSTDGAYEYVIERSQKRLAKNSFVTLIDEQAKWVQEQQDDSVFPLNYNAYVGENEALEKFNSKFKKLQDFQNQLRFSPTKFDLSWIQKDTIGIEKRKRWEETLSKDMYVDEAVNVLNDLAGLPKTTRKIAQINQ